MNKTSTIGFLTDQPRTSSPCTSSRWVNFATGETATNDQTILHLQNQAKQVRLQGTTRSGQPNPIRDHVFADLHGLYEGWLAKDLDETLVEVIPANTEGTGHYEIHLLAKKKLDDAKAHVDMAKQSDGCGLRYSGNSD